MLLPISDCSSDHLFSCLVSYSANDVVQDIVWKHGCDWFSVDVAR